MTFAFKTAGGAWVEVVGDTLLPGFGEPDGEGARHDVLVSEGWVASLTPQVRAARGLVAVAEIDRPLGAAITGQGLVDVGGVPTRRYQQQALSSGALAALIARRHDQIDAMAGDVITAAIPLWKQSNLTARAVDLLDIRSQRDLTSDEAAEQTRLRGAWAWVAAVRAHSETLKTALPADGPGAAAFDISTGWPSPPS